MTTLIFWFDWQLTMTSCNNSQVVLDSSQKICLIQSPVILCLP